ncbi:ly6/PLAUR domain-containing protein 1 isoform X1 [Heliangelus exortis]|uniref:ly6/PLAUR domain-containing protein 1 isoform X1 n=1 Tax=Heliangelus exortis TaxID=472823 RepID=UPI003A9208A9
MRLFLLAATFWGFCLAPGKTFRGGFLEGASGEPGLPGAARSHRGEASFLSSPSTELALSRNGAAEPAVLPAARRAPRRRREGASQPLALGGGKAKRSPHPSPGIGLGGCRLVTRSAWPRRWVSGQLLRGACSVPPPQALSPEEPGVGVPAEGRGVRCSPTGIPERPGKGLGGAAAGEPWEAPCLHDKGGWWSMLRSCNCASACKYSATSVRSFN